MTTTPAGPYNLLDAIRKLLPKTLSLGDGNSISMTDKWYLAKRLPQGAAPVTLPNPHGLISILRINPVHSNSAFSSPQYREAPTTQVDVLVFQSGTLSYLVTERDIESVTSISGTLGGSPHTFTPTTDYTFTDSSITWTGTGDLPDNATNFTVTYKHRLFYGRRAADSRIPCRVILKVKDLTISGRNYPKEVLAYLLADSLQLQLRLRSGEALVRQIDATTTQSYTQVAMLGPILGVMPVYTDESESLEAWAIDFQVRVSGVSESDPIRRILKLAGDPNAPGYDPDAGPDYAITT